MSPLIAFIGLIKSIITLETARTKRKNLKEVKRLMGDLETANKMKNRSHLKEVNKKLLEIGKDGI